MDGNHNKYEHINCSVRSSWTIDASSPEIRVPAQQLSCKDLKIPPAGRAVVGSPSTYAAIAAPSSSPPAIPLPSHYGVVRVLRQAMVAYGKKLYLGETSELPFPVSNRPSDGCSSDSGETRLLLRLPRVQQILNEKMPVHESIRVQLLRESVCVVSYFRIKLCDAVDFRCQGESY